MNKRHIIKQFDDAMQALAEGWLDDRNNGAKAGYLLGRASLSLDNLNAHVMVKINRQRVCDAYENGLKLAVKKAEGMIASCKKQLIGE